MTDALKKFEGGLVTELDKSADGFRNFVAIQYHLNAWISFIGVTGDIEVGNPGVDVQLVHGLQGIVPQTLVLEVLLIQRPGIWPPVMTWKRASYVALAPVRYSDVTLDAPFGSHNLPVTQLP